MPSSNTFITTPIYYVNDQPHIGHAYTTIAADVLARHYRDAVGADHVFFLTGTDEHGTKIANKADEMGKEPQQFTDEVAAQFKEAWAGLAISNDHFIRTTDADHTARVQKILVQLKKTKTPQGNDCIYESVYKGLYCVGCEKFLTEKDLVDGLCPDHRTAPQHLEEKNWFFRLSDYTDLIKQSIEKSMMTIHPVERQNETLGLIGQGLDDFSISRSTVTWGIPIPWDESQKAYVWVDALSNYITALGYPDDRVRVKQWWDEGAVVQLMAVDILKFHAVYWPAMLMALGLELPKDLYVHGFFTIDGQKMSKTLGNVIRPHELVRRYGADGTRYLILSQFSFGYESDIRVADFDAKYNADLANGLGNLVARVTNMIEKYMNGTVKTTPVKDEAFLKEVGGFIEVVRYREALIAIWKKIGECDQRIDREKPWKAFEENPAHVHEILTELRSSIYSIALALRSFMPAASKTVEDVMTTKTIVKYSGLFAKIEL